MSLSSFMHPAHADSADSLRGVTATRRAPLDPPCPRRRPRSPRPWSHWLGWIALSLAAVSSAAADPGAAASRTAGDAALDPQALERRLATLEREQHTLERSLARDEAELRTLRQRVIARGRAYYRVSRGGPTGQDWFEHAVRVERLRRGLLVDGARLKELTERRETTKERLALVRERRAPLAAESRDFEQMRSALLAQKEREEAFERAFLESRAAPHTAIYGAGPGLGVNDGSGFAQMRGRLPFPLPGRAEVEQVRRPWAQGTGLVMHAPAGTSVRAVFGGRVAFADTYGEYGKTVILDHADGYYTVSAHLGSIEVSAGDELAAGSRLGALGAGTSGRAVLYFEVRRANDTLPPSEWFGI